MTRTSTDCHRQPINQLPAEMINRLLKAHQCNDPSLFAAVKMQLIAEHPLLADKIRIFASQLLSREELRLLKANDSIEVC